MMDENLSRVFNFTEEGVFRKIAPSSRSRVDGLSSPRSFPDKNQMALLQLLFQKNLIRVIFTRNVKGLIVYLNVTALTAISAPGRIGEVLQSTLGRKMSSKWQRRKSYWFESGMKPFNVKDLESK